IAITRNNGRHKTSVVPAKYSLSSRPSEARAGTHNHRKSFEAKPTHIAPTNIRRGVWVPAFAGTTAMFCTHHADLTRACARREGLSAIERACMRAHGWHSHGHLKLTSRKNRTHLKVLEAVCMHCAGGEGELEPSSNRMNDHELAQQYFGFFRITAFC